jgi:hypothetical protein
MIDCFQIKNFLPEELYKQINNDVIKNEIHFTNDFIDKDGVFKGQQTTEQQWLKNNSKFVTELKKYLNNIESIKNHNIDGIQILNSFKPYDIHSDWVVTNNQIPLCDTKEFPPSYTVIIPLVSGDYYTVIFNQGAEYKDFWKYKKQNNTIENHCSNEDWEKYLNHCHKEDQKYVSIKQIYQWHRGDLFAFDRKLFHSASYHRTPKQGIVIWLSYPND